MKRGAKYLGIILDTKLKKLVSFSVEEAFKTTLALNKLMANTNGLN